VNKLEVDGITDGHYEDMIKALQAGLRQRQAIRDDEEHAQEYCFICEGNDHTADQCWFHNPLLLTTMGEYALIGDFWRCFHCGAVHTDPESAAQHFGDGVEEAAKCLQHLAHTQGFQLVHFMVRRALAGPNSKGNYKRTLEVLRDSLTLDGA
jgi:hypothetical protein